ncbi:hypothetical protein [Novosphingobium panipatense]|jgi:hypothetical protein|uniref:Conjugative transfer protein n=1 Tax=Novosphingobium panipatense TaxID=428991 RepID=A0ABY1Q781_9SPHN|nr:hypothetical protein [Novosphingobium panipatense]SMP60343.1 hypothetical protein SAMN06296065_10370 [Novosphingobium panipatense]
MAFHQTPFDHIGVWSPSMRLIPFLQGTCVILIEASRFAASSLLIVLGLPLFAFLFLAGWDMGLLFAQLSNLADHYREADAIRRIAFSQDLQGAFIAALLGVVLVRIPRFLKRFETALAPAAPKETVNG